MGFRGPARLETTTFMIGGNTSYRGAVDASRDDPVSTRGARNTDTSVVIRSFVSRRVCLASWEAAAMAASRLIGSAISVASVQSSIHDWLFISVWPGSRSVAGTPATIDLSGKAFLL